MAALTRAMTQRPGPTELGDAYDALVGEVRHLLNAIAGASLDAPTAERLRAHVADATASLTGHQAMEQERLWGRWWDRPGRGQALVPPVYDEVVTAEATRGKVVFGRFHVGENMAVHGGAVATLFDDVLGWLCVRLGLPPARTAYLHVDYRSVTPVGRELTVRGWVSRVDGRKVFIRGELRDGDNVCAEADGLWVQLRPGQP